MQTESTRTSGLFVLAGLLLSLAVPAIGDPTTASDAAASADWPQWRGPNRDGVAPSSPKLLDSWPKEGPTQLWKSEYIPGANEGGSGSPVVAGGKVFLYVNWKHPVGGGDKYHLITTELLNDWGWNVDLPDDLAKKIEAAWSAKDRPSSIGWPWWAIDWAKDAKDKELDAFLAKKPELDKYIKAFVATLDAKDAEKYGAYIKRRLCMCTEVGRWAVAPGLTWDQLVKLTKMRDVGYTSHGQWIAEIGKLGIQLPGAQLTVNSQLVVASETFLDYEWVRAVTLTDTMVCLDAATGKTIWKKDFAEDRDRFCGRYADMHSGHFGLLGASGTSAIWGGKCYIAGAMGLYCLAAKDGALIWKVSRAPAHASVLVADGIVYHCGAAYNAETGKLLWQDPGWAKIEQQFLDAVCGRTGRLPGQQLFGQAKWNSAHVWTSGGKNCILSSDGNASTCCFDMETGKVLWTVKGLYSTISGDILVAGGQSYKMTLSGAEPLCKNPLHAPVGLNGMSIVHDGYLYTIIDKAEFQPLWVNCSDLKTGEVTWEDKTKAQGVEGQLAMPILADGKLFIPFESCHRWTDHYIEMVKATPGEKYVSLGLFRPKELCPFTSPAFSGGALFVRLRDGVACYDLRAEAK